MQNKAQTYAPVILRIGLSIVFLWFGISQLINPQSFIGYVPQWISEHAPQMMHEHPLQWMHSIAKPSVHYLIMGNGLFETLFGSLLLAGLFTRISAFILGLHLTGIVFSLGYNDLMIRDFGLAAATFSIFLHGTDRWCMDVKRSRDKWVKSSRVTIHEA